MATHPVPLTADDSDRLDPASWLTHAERNPPSIRFDGSFVAAVDAFQANPDLRILPVLDRFRKPIGAIFERDVRKLLLNPFGHALMRNPAYGPRIEPHLRPCPMAEATLDLDALIAAYRRAQGTEGMILLRHGQLYATLSNRRLVNLAAEREVARAARRVERAARIEAASDRFEREVGSLADNMAGLARLLAANAEETMQRSALAGHRASAVASAAQQTGDHMTDIADRGHALTETLERIAARTHQADQSVRQAVTMMNGNADRMRELRRSATSIESVVELIGAIASQVNLLALNAAIEAARAGDAGRGFTVVANEVKALSNQTAQAAGRIAVQVRDMGTAIDSVGRDRDNIADSIASIEALSREIEAAISAQHGATGTIARRVQEVVDASETVRDDVEQIVATAQGASASAAEMQTLSGNLSRSAVALSSEAARLLAEIRAG